MGFPKVQHTSRLFTTGAGNSRTDALIPPHGFTVPRMTIICFDMIDCGRINDWWPPVSAIRRPRKHGILLGGSGLLYPTSFDAVIIQHALVMLAFRLRN